VPDACSPDAGEWSEVPPLSLRDRGGSGTHASGIHLLTENFFLLPESSNGSEPEVLRDRMETLFPVEPQPPDTIVVAVGRGTPGWRRSYHWEGGKTTFNRRRRNGTSRSVWAARPRFMMVPEENVSDNLRRGDSWRGRADAGAQQPCDARALQTRRTPSFRPDGSNLPAVLRRLRQPMSDVSGDGWSMSRQCCPAKGIQYGRGKWIDSCTWLWSTARA